MKTNQAWGWLLAAVVAAGLNASYYDGGLQWAHQIADRLEQHSEMVLARATGQADQFLAEARMLTARNEAASCPWSTAVARVESRIARSQGRFQVMSAREEAQQARLQANREAQMARLEANRARMEAQFAANAAHFRVASAAFAPITLKGMPAVVCPRVRVNIPRVPMVKMPVVPEIHVEMAGTGPV